MARTQERQTRSGRSKKLRAVARGQETYLDESGQPKNTVMSPFIQKSVADYLIWKNLGKDWKYTDKLNELEYEELRVLAMEIEIFEKDTIEEAKRKAQSQGGRRF